MNLENYQTFNKKLQITRGHKTCRFQWVFERFVPPRKFVSRDTDIAPQSATFHTATWVWKPAGLNSREGGCIIIAADVVRAIAIN